MTRTRRTVITTGLVLIASAMVAYLGAIWGNDAISERCALTGLLFLIPGIIVVIVGALMKDGRRA